MTWFIWLLIVISSLKVLDGLIGAGSHEPGTRPHWIYTFNAILNALIIVGLVEWYL